MKNVDINDNLNVYGTTAVRNTFVNNTSFNSFSVSGPSNTYSNNLTLHYDHHH